MDIASKTKVTTVYSSTVSPDEAKALALVAVKGKIGLAAGTVVISSDATLAADGSISVEVVVDASADAPAVEAPVAAEAVQAPAPGDVSAEAPATAAPVLVVPSV